MKKAPLTKYSDSELPYELWIVQAKSAFDHCTRGLGQWKADFDQYALDCFNDGYTAFKVGKDLSRQ